jgi:hypothetical protein
MPLLNPLPYITMAAIYADPSSKTITVSVFPKEFKKKTKGIE